MKYRQSNLSNRTILFSTKSIFDQKIGDVTSKTSNINSGHDQTETGVEINFSNNLPVGQVISSVYLPEGILTCPKKKGTISFEALYLWKKICKMYLLIKTLNFYSTCILFCRGGVEDTRLEAKAKNTKKSLAKAKDRQPFRGQTLSRPRTGMLEAKDQGHSRKCSQKKKVFKKVFRVISIL